MSKITQKSSKATNRKLRRISQQSNSNKIANDVSISTNKLNDSLYIFSHFLPIYLIATMIPIKVYEENDIEMIMIISMKMIMKCKIGFEHKE